MGYANTRAVPLHWLWFGAVRTLLESWNANWNGVATTNLFENCIHPLRAATRANLRAKLRLGRFHCARLHADRGATSG
jgi:hypothetical protein